MIAPNRDCLVMLVEDNPDVRDSILMLLQLKGYRTVGVEDGAAALRQLCRMDELPCLILLDLMMPVMDGWELTQELQRNALFAKIPIVVLSAIRGDKLIFDNVVARLTKMAHEDELIATLERVCSSQQAMRPCSSTCLGASRGPQLIDSDA